MAKAQVQDLVVRLMADSRQYSATLSQGVDDARNFSVEVEKSLTAGIPKIAAGIAGIATAAVGTTAAFGALTHSIAQDAKQVSMLASNLNLTTESLQRMTYAASMYGIEAEEFPQLITDMQERLTEFVKIGGGEAVDMFEQLGISVDNFKGKAPDEMFNSLVTALGTVEDPAERNLYLMQILGEEGLKLNDVIDDGGEQFRKYANSMNPAAIYTKQLVESSRLYDIETKKLGASLDGVLNVAVSGSIPLLTEFTEWSTNAALAVQTWMDSLSKSPVTLAGAEDKLGDLNSQIDKQTEKVNEADKAVKKWEESTASFAGAQAETWARNAAQRKAELDSLTAQANETKALIDELKAPSDPASVPVWGGAGGGGRGGVGGTPEETNGEEPATGIALAGLEEGLPELVGEFWDGITESERHSYLERLGYRKEYENKAAEITGKAQALQKKDAVKLAKVQKAAQDLAINDGMSALRAFGEQSRTAFEIYKVAAIANASLKAMEAVPAAWAAGMSTGGPWAPAVAAAYAGASLLKTAGMIKQISSMSYGSSGSGGSSVSGGGAMPTPGTATGAGSSDFVDAVPDLPSGLDDTQNAGAGITVIVQGDILDGEQFEDKVIGAFSNAVNVRGVSPMNPQSIQAQELRG